MKLFTFIAGLLLSQVGICQVPLSRGHYNISGLGERKQALLDAGGNSLDMAIAMVETENMTPDYPLGDGKIEDWASFGIFKQNWFMLRTGATEFIGHSAAEYLNGAVLNDDLIRDAETLHDAVDYYGFGSWAAGHCNGASGIKNPNTQDIQNYKAMVTWIKDQIDSDSKYLTDDTRFWVGVTA